LREVVERTREVLNGYKVRERAMAKLVQRQQREIQELREVLAYY
jgi:flagellar biosynthesis chaperone FliJ